MKRFKSVALLMAVVFAFCACTGNNDTGSGSAKTESTGTKQENSPKKNRRGTLVGFSYSPGYGDMGGEYHLEKISLEEEGLVYIMTDREDHGSPEVATVYACDEDGLEVLQELIDRYDLCDLEKRRKSDEEVSDYSPWRFSLTFESSSGKRSHVSFHQFQKYKQADYEHMDEFLETARSLRGEVLRTETEGDSAGSGTSDSDTETAGNTQTGQTDAGTTDTGNTENNGVSSRTGEYPIRILTKEEARAEFGEEFDRVHYRLADPADGADMIVFVVDDFVYTFRFFSMTVTNLSEDGEISEYTYRERFCREPFDKGLVCVTAPFYGSMPNNGFSYWDRETFQYRTYAITQSGYDGTSYELTELDAEAGVRERVSDETEIWGGWWKMSYANSDTKGILFFPDGTWSTVPAEGITSAPIGGYYTTKQDEQGFYYVLTNEDKNRGLPRGEMRIREDDSTGEILSFLEGDYGSFYR